VVGIKEPKTQPRGRYLIDNAIDVIARPAAFFRAMPRSGGLADPFLFLLMIGVLTGLVNMALSPFIAHQTFGMALASVAFIPLMLAIFGFVVAGFLFLIWKVMGSSESYATSYRCMAYASAILPIAVVLGAIPYLGTAIFVFWWMWLLVTASIQVHGLRQSVAVAVFGAFGVGLLLLALTAEYTARQNAVNAALDQQIARWSARVERELSRPDEEREWIYREMHRVRMELGRH
jgi:hypothetical protein